MSDFPSFDADGVQLSMLPERALLWREQAMLILADVHFGKAAAFRAGGIPVPHGTTQANLARIDALVARHGVQRIVFLGDFLHARSGRAPHTLATLAQWRARHAALELTLVRGNHDSHAGDPPPELDMQVVDEPWRLGPLAFCHHPQTVAGAFALVGHLHPVYRLAAAGDALRLPCFVVDGRWAMLPAFGEFTGGYRVTPAPGQRLYLAADDCVLPLPD
ncbi:ligase-associated DNA damage response endonuclease PdeM [Herbaspirillum seropedicae]|uniref:Calcineurin-like phosphoesterase protein n=1 Tax=Herbaspirillum seropedicae (strain SmR1) TaxID=757424 RepID=D8IUB3_HERSS|nr:ligase-associated DNA damage response endonuclease PdeM [Herbaspirillum seropedicae]ADJ63775.1 calcineurin-like phosphoesterase protein [Herbaspirillum seropedicae SmR1]AKN65785.1 DEAD/DEAH box helicase [Herbaspirillum seropedicae]AON54610.1 calcineurin-like phosphoesterase [Herbaspirillum seropedicae]NQE28942.1 DEAD/DEAH box helicase [Herbaspirillum seropedicae]UMU21754.1 ligase-associated DNA damage response endonuclease PdeM [Herbaspirillum seropedicae]